MGEAPEGDLLTPCQAQLLSELEALVENRDVDGPLADYDSFVCHVHRSKECQKSGSEAELQMYWDWARQLEKTCKTTLTELNVLLGHLDELDRTHRDAAEKTGLLDRQGESVIRSHEELDGFVEAISQQLRLVDSSEEIRGVLDRGGILGSLAGFGGMLDQMEASVAHVERHYYFREAKACLHQYEHLRNRACILMRTTLQRGLERAADHVGQLLEESPHGYVDTQIFYTPFHSVAAQHRPLAALLRGRALAHRLYASTLDELEGFYANLRAQLIGEPMSEHFRLSLEGAFDPQSPPGTPLTQTMRQTIAYFLDASQREKRCFLAFFEPRKPQDALELLLRHLGGLLCGVLQPMVRACSSVDALREMAECLHADFLEPNQQSQESDVPQATLATISRLHTGACSRLVDCAQAQIRRGAGHRDAPGEDALDYPAVLFPAAPAGSPTNHRTRENWRRWFPALDDTLGILAKTYRVLQAEAFEALAQEAVAACVGSLRRASGLLEQRPLAGPGDPSRHAVRSMNAGLFLVRHLLVLRQQISAFECDWKGRGRHTAAAPESCVRLPKALLSPAAARLRHSQAGRNEAVEVALKAACAKLVVDLTAWISQPLAAARARADAQEMPSLSVGSLARDGARQLHMEPDAFLRNVRSFVPLTVAHFRAYLTESPAASGAQKCAAMEDGAAAALFRPVQERLVGIWSRVLRKHGCLDPGGTAGGPGALAVPAAGPTPRELEELISSLFSDAMRMPWAQVADTVSTATGRGHDAAQGLSSPRDPG